MQIRRSKKTLILLAWLAIGSNFVEISNASPGSIGALQLKWAAPHRRKSAHSAKVLDTQTQFSHTIQGIRREEAGASEKASRTWKEANSFAQKFVKKTLTLEFVTRINLTLQDESSRELGGLPGELRDYDFDPNWGPPLHQEVPQFLKSLLEETQEAMIAGKDPIRVASDFYVRFLWIHPFANGNGRTARIVVNKIIQDAGLPPPLWRNDLFARQNFKPHEVVKTNRETAYRWMKDAVEESLRTFEIEKGLLLTEGKQHPVPRTEKLWSLIKFRNRLFIKSKTKDSEPAPLPGTGHRSFEIIDENRNLAIIQEGGPEVFGIREPSKKALLVIADFVTGKTWSRDIPEKFSRGRILPVVGGKSPYFWIGLASEKNDEILLQKCIYDGAFAPVRILNERYLVKSSLKRTSYLEINQGDQILPKQVHLKSDDHVTLKSLDFTEFQDAGWTLDSQKGD